MNFTPWIFPKKFKLTCLSLRWIWFPCVSLSMISVVFCVFCPWNSFPGFLTDQLFTWRKSYMKKLISTGFQSIDTFFLWTLQRFSYNNLQRKLVIRRNYQQRFFHERFSKEDCELGFFQMILFFSTFWSLTKISEGCLWMKLVDLLPNIPVFLHCICMKSVHLAFPSVKWFWFLFHHFWRQFSWRLFRQNKLPETFHWKIQFDLFEII